MAKNNLTAAPKPAKTQTITVKVNEAEPEFLEVLAKAIIEVADAFKKIEEGPLKRHTVVLLIQDETKLAQRDINAVLNACSRLKHLYIKEVKK